MFPKECKRKVPRNVCMMNRRTCMMNDSKQTQLEGWRELQNIARFRFMYIHFCNQSLLESRCPRSAASAVVHPRRFPREEYRWEVIRWRKREAAARRKRCRKFVLLDRKGKAVRRVRVMMVPSSNPISRMPVSLGPPTIFWPPLHHPAKLMEFKVILQVNCFCFC